MLRVRCSILLHVEDITAIIDRMIKYGFYKIRSGANALLRIFFAFTNPKSKYDMIKWFL